MLGYNVLSPSVYLPSAAKVSTDVRCVMWNWPFSAVFPKPGLGDPRAPTPPPAPYKRPRTHSYSSPRCPSSWSPHWPSIRCSFEPMTASSRVLVNAHCNRQPAARPLREHWTRALLAVTIGTFTLRSVSRETLNCQSSFTLTHSLRRSLSHS